MCPLGKNRVLAQKCYFSCISFAHASIGKGGADKHCKRKYSSRRNADAAFLHVCAQSDLLCLENLSTFEFDAFFCWSRAAKPARRSEQTTRNSLHLLWPLGKQWVRWDSKQRFQLQSSFICSGKICYKWTLETGLAAQKPSKQQGMH